MTEICLTKCGLYRALVWQPEPNICLEQISLLLPRMDAYNWSYTTPVHAYVHRSELLRTGKHTCCLAIRPRFHPLFFHDRERRWWLQALHYHWYICSVASRRSILFFWLVSVGLLNLRTGFVQRCNFEFFMCFRVLLFNELCPYSGRFVNRPDPVAVKGWRTTL